MRWFKRPAVATVAAALLALAGLVTGPFAAPADAVTLPRFGAAAKPAAFVIRPPWSPGETERVTCEYGCGGHQGIANPFASNDRHAVDFGMFRGEPVRAVASGVVAWADHYPPPNSWSCYGNSVAINHDGPGAGHTSMYAHLDALTVKRGERVQAGDMIGLTGGSGGGSNLACPAPFAPHLHFVLYRGAITGNHPPYGGTSVVPEPFAFCTKASGAPCEDLTGGDRMTALPDGATAATPTPTVPAQDDATAADSSEPDGQPEQSDAPGPTAAAAPAIAVRPAPGLVMPIGGLRLAAFSAPLRWNATEDTRQYQLQVTPERGDGPGLDLILSGRGGSFDLHAAPDWYLLLPDMTYSWRVRTSDSAAALPDDAPAWSAWSVSATFQTPTASAQTISAASPPPDWTVATTTPTLVWTDADPAVWLYEVQVSADHRFETGPARATAAVLHEIQHGGLSNPVNSYTVPASAGIKAGETWYWRVRPRVQGDGEPVAWSPTWAFTVR